MFESEIHNYKWNISPRLKIISIRSRSISSYESENIINIMERGLIDDTKPIVDIDCSYQKYITKYRRSELFTLTGILVSTINKDEKKGRYILSIKGTMPLIGITIRNKKIKIKDEYTQKRKENMKIQSDNYKKKIKRD